MEKTPIRKVIQIATARASQERVNEDETLGGFIHTVALCDDGTLWYDTCFANGEPLWAQYPDVPDQIKSATDYIPRKIIQVCTALVESRKNPVLGAHIHTNILCNDGTIWCDVNKGAPWIDQPPRMEWRQLSPGVPGTKWDWI